MDLLLGYKIWIGVEVTEVYSNGGSIFNVEFSWLKRNITFTSIRIWHGDVEICTPRVLYTEMSVLTPVVKIWMFEECSISTPYLCLIWIIMILTGNGGLLWILHGSRDCILHIHICSSGQGALPESNQSHKSCIPVWSCPLWCCFPNPSINWHIGLLWT